MDRTARYPGTTGFIVFALDSLFTLLSRALWGEGGMFFFFLLVAVISVPIAMVLCEAAFMNTFHRIQHRQGKPEDLGFRVTQWMDLFFGFSGLCFGVTSTLGFSIHENFSRNWLISILVILCCNGVCYCLWSNWRSYSFLRRTLSALLSMLGACLTWILILFTFYVDTGMKPREAMELDMVNLAVYSRQYRMRPQSEGGGSGSFVGLVIPKKMASNVNGYYSMTIISADTIEFIGVARDSQNGVSVKVDSTGKLHDWRYRGDYQ